MRSPFPGMDPYLEIFWGDVHHTMINRSRAAIQKQLPPDLVARVDERVFVEPTAGVPRNIIPDVRVVERGVPQRSPVSSTNGIAVAEPLIIEISQDEPLHQGFIEIIDLKSGRHVVTVIEIVSPSNKVTGPGDLYLKKQGELRDAGVNLVEIDLNRTGNRVFSVPAELIPETHRTPYGACVRRGWKPLTFEYYPLHLRERLSVIAIPLRQTEPDVPLDLQTVLDECCDEGRYIDDIDYRQEPEPRLGVADAQWADALLREHKLR